MDRDSKLLRNMQKKNARVRLNKRERHYISNAILIATKKIIEKGRVRQGAVKILNGSATVSSRVFRESLLREMNSCTSYARLDENGNWIRAPAHRLTLLSCLFFFSQSVIYVKLYNPVDFTGNRKK